MLINYKGINVYKILLVVIIEETYASLGIIKRLSYNLPMNPPLGTIGTILYCLHANKVFNALLLRNWYQTGCDLFNMLHFVTYTGKIPLRVKSILEGGPCPKEHSPEFTPMMIRPKMIISNESAFSPSDIIRQPVSAKALFKSKVPFLWWSMIRIFLNRHS